MRTLVSNAALGLLLLLGACASNRFKATANERITVAYRASSGVEITTRNGSIDIEGGAEGDEIVVDAKITACGNSLSEAEHRLAQVKVRCDRDAETQELIVRALFADEARGGDGVSYVVRLPDSDGVHLRTSNGRIKIRGIHGRIDAKTSNGRVEVRDHRGEVSVVSSNGSVDIADASGPVRVHTSNGKVGLRLDREATGPVDLHSSNGSIHLRVGSGFAGDLSLATSNGRIRCENSSAVEVARTLGKRSGTVQFSKKGAPSKIYTSNGGIRVTIED